MNFFPIRNLQRRWLFLTRRSFATKLFSARWDPGSGYKGIGEITGKKLQEVDSYRNVPSQETVTNLPPLDKPLPDLPDVEFAKPLIRNEKTKITTLSNGLRVASEPSLGQFCTVGLVINSGSRHEASFTKGISHFLEKIAFGATEEFPHRDAVLKQMEKYGSICDCQSSRDGLVYVSSFDHRQLNAVLKLLADVILNPLLSDEDIYLASKAVAFELESLFLRPEQEPLLLDMIHEAAYGYNTLGLPKLCPFESLYEIDRDVIANYVNAVHKPERMVVVGVGVNHEEFVDIVQKYFDLHKDNEGSTRTEEVDTKAVYVGGMSKEISKTPLYEITSVPELTHVVLGFESCSHQHPDFEATCVLNVILGGGGSFSAGGPGKGIHSRLYTNVLNRYHWMFNATAYNHTYTDTGLFCIHSSCPPSFVNDMVHIILHELMKMCSGPNFKELERAKVQLESMLLMNLESRPVELEDIGRQILAAGYRKRPEVFIKAIHQVTPADISRIAKGLLSTPISVAVRGNHSYLPSLEVIHAALNFNGHQVLPKKVPSYK